MTAPDLDALEKLADEAMLPMSVNTMRMHKKAVREFRVLANPWKIKALIAELKEARAIMTDAQRCTQGPALDDRIRAFLDRTKGGEG